GPLTAVRLPAPVSSAEEDALADEADADRPGRPGTDVPTGTVVTSRISPASAGSVRGPAASRKVNSVAAVMSSAPVTTSQRRRVRRLSRSDGSPGMAGKANCLDACSMTSASSCSDMALLGRALSAIVLSEPSRARASASAGAAGQHVAGRVTAYKNTQIWL